MVNSSTVIICASFVGHNHKLSFTFSYDLRKEVSFCLFCLILQVLAHKVSFISGRHSAVGHHFAAAQLMLKSFS